MCNVPDNHKKSSLLERLKSKLSKNKNEQVGKDFVPGGNSVQEGVNPNSLNPSKDLNTLNSQRIKSAVQYAGDKPIIVDPTGKVLDGRHRLKYAIDNNKAVDVSIGY